MIESLNSIRTAGSGDPAYRGTRPTTAGAAVGPVSSPGVPKTAPRRLRRLHRVWPDRDGNISYLLTICVDGRGGILDNEPIFARFVDFLLDSPRRYRWFGRRFVVMPDHIHLIAHMGQDAVRLGQWIKALKAVVGGLRHREERLVSAPGLQPSKRTPGSGDPAYSTKQSGVVGRVPSRAAPPSPPHDAGRVPPPGVPAPSHGDHPFTRVKRAWQWQDGFHDHKFRTPESEHRKWEYVCLNPVRAKLAVSPEEWPFGGEIFYDEPGGPRFVRGTPPLLETGLLMEEGETPRQGTRPAK